MWLYFETERQIGEALFAGMFPELAIANSDVKEYNSKKHNGGYSQMKKYMLSTPDERVKGIAFSIVISVALVFLLTAVWGNLAIFLISAVAVALIVTILVIYVLNVSKAACVVKPENNQLVITGFRQRTIDLASVSCLETIPVKSGQVESRSLAFTDSEGRVVAIVPTYFTSKRGVLAEPMAKEMAEALNLNFRANVPAWEYDEEARKIHEQEVAQQQKEDAKIYRERRKAARVAKIRKKMKQMQDEK